MNELYEEVKTYRQKLLKEIENRLTYEDSKYLYDEVSMIKKMAWFYVAVNELIDCYHSQKSYLKVGMRYEIKTVMDSAYSRSAVLQVVTGVNSQSFTRRIEEQVR